MAERDCSTRLLVCFWHENRVEGSITVLGPDAALKAAQELLAARDGLYDQDEITVDAVPVPGLVERKLA